MPISLKSTGGGSITLEAPATASDYTLTFPAQNGTPITTLPSTAGNVLTSDGTNWVSQAPASTGAVPVGGIIYYPSTSAPSGYLKCDGTIYNRSSYSALSTVIGTPALLGAETLRASSQTVTSDYSFVTSMSSVNGVAFMPGSSGVNGTTVGANALRTSSDGITWTLRTALSSPLSQASVVYINNTYIMRTYAGTYTSNLTTTLNYQTSTDLSTWTSRSISTGSERGASDWIIGNATKGVAVMQVPRVYDNGCEIVYTTPWTAYYSSNGTSWTQCASYPSTGMNNAPAAGPSTFVGTGRSWDKVYYSSDGSTWTDITSNIASLGTAATLYYRCVWNGSAFYLFCNNNVMLTSTTGASGTWSVAGNVIGLNTSTTNNMFGGFQTDTRVMGQTYYWTFLVSGSTYIISYIYYNGANTNVFISNDMLNWSLKTGLAANYSGLAGSNVVGRTSSTSIGFYTQAVTGYATATEFPVPSLISPNSSNSSSPVPVAYIKT